jgi:20S proteasome subunit beta 1
MLQSVGVAPFKSTSDCLPSTMEQQHMMGTTIMAVEFDGGVVLGADSRTTTGAYIANRVSDKITPLAERIYCCRSGSAADTQAISDYVRYYLSIHELDLDDWPLVKTAASICRELCYSNKDRLLAGMICAGWDPHYGGQVYTIPLGGTMVRQPYSIGGSGSTYIYGFCDAHFQKGMSREQCIEFTKKAIALAMTRDGSSGGVIRLVVVEESGVSREMIAGQDLPSISAE